MRTIRRFALLLLALFAASAPAPAPAADAEPAGARLERSPRHHEWVEVKTPAGRTVRAFVVYPQVDKPAPGVLVIHENRGLTDWVRGVADRLAEAGYIALAPDLLSGAGPDGGGTAAFPSSDAARDAIYKLPDEQVTADLDACFAWLRGLDATTDAVAVAGFCWGGSQSFRYATHNAELKGAFVFYGSAPQDPVELAKIKAPVFGFYGGKDFRITGEVPKVREAMQQAGKRYEPQIYEGAGHAFLRTGADEPADPANRSAAEQAWQRWLEQLKLLTQ